MEIYKKLNFKEKLWIVLLTTSVIINAGLLWLTKVEWLPSQSAFFDADNLIYYVLMHASMIWLFFVLGAIYGSRRPLWTILGFVDILVVVFNMLDDKLIHNGATGLVVLLSIIACVKYRYKRNTITSDTTISLATISGVIFFLAAIKQIHMFTAEFIVESLIGTCIIIDTLIKKR